LVILGGKHLVSLFYPTILIYLFIFRPLSEPKELKLKFDAIFEVERFVKVMDGIRKSAKDFVWLSIYF
jgi:hypothetical protein